MMGRRRGWSRATASRRSRGFPPATALVLCVLLTAPACGRGAETASASAEHAASGAAEHPDPPPASPGSSALASAASPAPSPAANAPLSIRFVVRKQESNEEIPAGYFEVRLVSLEAVKQADEAGSPAVSPAPSPAGAAAGAKRGSSPTPSPAVTTATAPPQQMLITQPDGSKQTFLVGVVPGAYALRITAPGRKMLLRTLQIRPGDRMFDIALDPESTPQSPSPSAGP